MTQRLTAETLAAIRKRTESATEGPWFATKDSFWTDDTVIGPGITAEVYDESDAAFIANARQDIPMLLAEVDRLQENFARIAELTELFYEVDPTISGKVIVMRIRPELEKYREIIQDILVISREEASE